MVKRVNVLCRVVAVALATGSAAMAADQTILPTSVCHTAMQGTNAIFFDYYGAGFSQANGGLGIMACGIGHDKAALDSNDDVVIYYTDSNGGTGAHTNFQCAAIEANSDFSTTMTTGPVYGCPTVGGCATDNTVVSYSSNSGQLKLVDISHGGDYATSVYCVFPDQGAGLPSIVKTIVLDEQ